jgi:hypothetical protein
MNLHDTLLKKASADTLGHFYIIETPVSEDLAHEILVNFIHSFIQDYFQKIEGHKQSLLNLMDHPDVFILGNLPGQNEKSDKLFKVEEAKALGRFFEFKPVQGKRKFAVITEGHRINSMIANKWLKLFEEPQGQSTIFLLNPRRTQLLPTIHSRAIHLRIQAQSETFEVAQWDNMLSDLLKMTLSEFIEKYSRGDQDISFWVNELMSWEALQTDHAKPKQELTFWLKSFHEMEQFNQPSATKWILFYSYLKEYVLPRLN